MPDAATPPRSTSQTEVTPLLREHVVALRSAGLSWDRIAAEAHTSRETVRAVATGVGRGGEAHHERVYVGTAERLLAMRVPAVDTMAGMVTVDSTGTRRRIQALKRRGWSIPLIAENSGLERQAIDGALNGERVTARTARHVVHAYDALWDLDPPMSTPHQRAAAARARNRALSNGWLAPMEWDDDVIDDPLFQPTSMVDDSRRGTNYDELWHLVEGGVSMEEAAQRMGVQLDSVSQRLRSRRAAVTEDVARRMARRTAAGLNPEDAVLNEEPRD